MLSFIVSVNSLALNEVGERLIFECRVNKELTVKSHLLDEGWRNV